MRFSNRHLCNRWLTSYYNILELCVCVCLISVTYHIYEQQNKKQYEMFQNRLYIFCTITQISKPHQLYEVNWTDGTVFFTLFHIQYWRNISTIVVKHYHTGIMCIFFQCAFLFHYVAVNDGKIDATISLYSSVVTS